MLDITKHDLAELRRLLNRTDGRPWEIHRCHDNGTRMVGPLRAEYQEDAELVEMLHRCAPALIEAAEMVLTETLVLNAKIWSPEALAEMQEAWRKATDQHSVQLGMGMLAAS